MFKFTKSESFHRFKNRQPFSAFKNGRICLYYKADTLQEYMKILDMCDQLASYKDVFMFDTEHPEINCNQNDFMLGYKGHPTHINKNWAKIFSKHMSDQLSVQKNYISSISNIISELSFSSHVDELNPNTSEPNSPTIRSNIKANQDAYRILLKIHWSFEANLKNSQIKNVETVIKKTKHRNLYYSAAVILDQLIDLSLCLYDKYPSEINNEISINKINVDFIKDLSRICEKIKEYLDIIYSLLSKLSKKKQENLISVLKDHSIVQIKLQFEILNMSVSH